MVQQLTTSNEAIVREVLARGSAGADLLSDVVTLTRAPEPDRLALARIGRERDAALARYRRDRDAGALEATMGILDEQERAVREAGPEPMPAAEVVERLRDVAAVWAAAPASRRAIAESLFERSRSSGCGGCGSRRHQRRSLEGLRRRFRAHLLVMVGARGIAPP